MTMRVSGAPISPKTRNWAVSAIALATITLLIQIVSGALALRTPNQFYLSPMFNVTRWTVQVVGMAISVGFILGGVKTMQGEQSGPEILEYTAIAAAILVVVSAFYQFALINSASYKEYLSSQMAKAVATNPAAAGQTAHILPLIGTVTMGFIVVMTIIQVGYSVGMYRHMSAR